MKNPKVIRVAILDLYDGQENEGMRCIRDILRRCAMNNQLDFTYDEFDVRTKNQLPDLSYDIYISSGGPGSPLASEDSEWEFLYFQWLRSVEYYNDQASHPAKKHVLFICHSYQVACRYFKVAHVSKRRSTAFGVFPIHMTPGGKEEPLFAGLHDPFYAVDSRDYQVTEPDQERLDQIGATVLAIEKERPHVPLERAIMAMRFNDYMVGTQFHPEADAQGMLYYLQSEDKKPIVIESHGYEKWESMVEQLNDPDKILHTYSHVLPNFLEMAVKQLHCSV